MSLVIALGSNLGDKKENLIKAINLLSEIFDPPIAISSIYSSAPVGGISQPDFLNMAVEFNIPELSPLETLSKCLAIEEQMGRKRIQKWGPRNIDIDILYFSNTKVDLPDLTIPHPFISERSFVVRPLMELPYYTQQKASFDFPNEFEIDAYVYDKITLKGKN